MAQEWFLTTIVGKKPMALNAFLGLKGWRHPERFDEAALRN
jgi:hypothetical protein